MGTTVTLTDALGAEQEHYTSCPTVDTGQLLPSRGCTCGDVTEECVATAPHTRHEGCEGVGFLSSSALLNTRQTTADAHTSAAHDVIVSARPVSALEGHELRDVTTDRARAIGTLRTVACTCTATQYTADGLERAAAFHDEERAGVEKRAAERAHEERRNGLVLLSRYGTDEERAHALEELAREELDILPPTDDDDTSTLEERITRTVQLHSARGKLWDGRCEHGQYAPCYTCGEHSS